MQILIVGAGALGGYFGARLLAAGRDVTFLVRSRRAAQLLSDGLRVESPFGNLHLQAPPTVQASALQGSYDLILLSCKAHDLSSAMDDFAPAVGPETAILPLLNGMAHMHTLAARFGPEHVLGGLSNISATLTPEGVVRQLGNVHRLAFGDPTQAPDTPASPRLQAIARTLADANFDDDLSPRILHEMWVKWVSIATYAGTTCLMRAAIGDIVAAGGLPFAQALLAECASVATAEGYPPAPGDLDYAAGMISRTGSLFTASMLRDLEAGAPVECQQILGDLLQRAQQRSLPTPVLAIAHAHVRSYEERRKRESIQLSSRSPSV